MRWIAALALVACADPAPPARPALSPATAPDAPASAPPSVAPASEAAAPVDAKARFEARQSQPLPAALPKDWRALPPALDAKVLSVRHLVFTRIDGAPPHREVDLLLRIFGDDAANDARVKAALAPWPGAEVETDRVKGAPPRESQYAIRWAHTPADPGELTPCKKPPAVDLPPEAPAWLDRITNARSTRRRIGAGVEHAAAGPTLELWMRYQNGYARDEAVGHFAAEAARQGFTRARGDALKQTWTHADGRRLWWRPDNGRLHLGCTLAGPVLVLTLAPGE